MEKKRWHVRVFLPWMEEKILVEELKCEWKNCKEKGGMDKSDLTDCSSE